MRINRCPQCRKTGFLTFRKIRRWERPYVGHYDSEKYAREKRDFENGKRKSKPTGRRWCSIVTYEAEWLDFEDEWYPQYLLFIKKIYSSYKKFGFKDLNYVRESFLSGKIKRNLMKNEFTKDPKWANFWQGAENLLLEHGFARKFVQNKIRHDIFTKHLDSDYEKDPILTYVLID